MSADRRRPLRRSLIGRATHREVATSFPEERAMTTQPDLTDLVALALAGMCKDPTRRGSKSVRRHSSLRAHPSRVGGQVQSDLAPPPDRLMPNRRLAGAPLKLAGTEVLGGVSGHSTLLCIYFANGLGHFVLG